MQAVAASGDDRGIIDLEKENSKLKEELSSLPELKKELESLRVRVTELSKLTSKIVMMKPFTSVEERCFTFVWIEMHPSSSILSPQLMQKSSRETEKLRVLTNQLDQSGRRKAT